MTGRPRKAVLIIGASGIAGKSAVQEFIDAGWVTYGVSRGYPEILAPRHQERFIHHSLDLFDVEACQRVLQQFSSITHVVYSALIESEGDLQDSWRSSETGRMNQTMMENAFSVLFQVCQNLEHVQWLQGTKAYGVHYHPIFAPARERQPRDLDKSIWVGESQNGYCSGCLLT